MNEIIKEEMEFINYEDTMLLFDVKKGNVFETNKTVFDLMSFDGSETLESLRNKSKDYLDEETFNSIIDDFTEAGLLVKENEAYSSKKPECKVSPIRTVDMIISNDCNLRCRYCFAGEGAYHDERQLMNFEVAKNAIDFLINKSGNEEKLSVCFFGGEPLMNIPVIKQVVQYAKPAVKNAGKKIAFHIATNGTMLTKDLIEYCHKNNIHIQIACDGDQDTQDHNRPYSGGQGTYNDIIENLHDVLPKQKRVTARTTISPVNIEHLENNIDHLLSVGFSNVFFAPANGKEFPDIFINNRENLDKLNKQITMLAHKFLSELNKGRILQVSNFIKTLNIIHEKDKKSYPCGAGRGYISIGVKGNIYFCHRFVGRKEYDMGNIMDSTYNEKWTNYIVDELHIENNQYCNQCWARYICGGQCLAEAETYSGSLKEPDPLLCDFRKHLFKTVLFIYSQLSDKQKALLFDKK